MKSLELALSRDIRTTQKTVLGTLRTKPPLNTIRTSHSLQRVAKGIDEKMCNALLLKVNQIGTVTESIEAVRMSKKAGWGVMTSHRSGETEDSFIADLAVGLATVSN